jgi:hypothetical protein
MGIEWGSSLDLLDLKKGYDAVRNEVLYKVSYNTLFDYVIFL